MKLNQTYKNFQSLYGSVPEITSKFYDENFEIITLRSNLTIEYDQITKIIETKKLCLLMVGRQGTILTKSGFINGDFRNFKSFIEKKCTNI